MAKEQLAINPRMLVWNALSASPLTREGLDGDRNYNMSSNKAFSTVFCGWLHESLFSPLSFVKGHLYITLATLYVFYFLNPHLF